jgi:hypothetical protein
MLLVTAGVGSLLLALTSESWSSGGDAALYAAGFGLLALAVIQERRAERPLLPAVFFRNSIFTVCTAIGFLFNLARWSVIVYLPLYLQVSRGMSPVESALYVSPLFLGALLSSVGSGHLITRFGRYKIYPLLGTGVATLGLFLLSRPAVLGDSRVLALVTFASGIGVGLVFAVLVLALQNAVRSSDLGVATASSAFFRAVGSSFGVALFGAILASRLAHWLRASAAGPAPSAGSLLHATPSQLGNLAPPLHAAVAGAFAHAVQDLFLAAVPFSLAAFVLTFFLHEAPLRVTEGDTEEAPTPRAARASRG